jgi:hypothetical protein
VNPSRLDCESHRTEIRLRFFEIGNDNRYMIDPVHHRRLVPHLRIEDNGNALKAK